MHHFQSEVAAVPCFEDFLQAQIGLSRTGMPISVRSAMARQGLDPHHEAGRLARLPPRQARATLAAFIHRIVEGTWGEAEVRGKAERLVRLLPPAPDMPRTPDRRLVAMAILIITLLLVTAATYWTGSWPPDPGGWM